MSAYGVSAGINFKFGGTVASTMDAHRVVQHFQEEKGPEVADKIINCKCKGPVFAETGAPWFDIIAYRLFLHSGAALYSQYFENEKHPSADETLLKATTDAGIPESEAKPFIEDKNDGMLDVKNMVRQQAGNGVDAVPTIMFEGKRRDITLVGAKEVEEYEKTLKQIVKESK
jgi:predicted DsbA family dithiol-disulfide isomerase